MGEGLRRLLSWAERQKVVLERRIDCMLVNAALLVRNESGLGEWFINMLRQRERSIWNNLSRRKKRLQVFYWEYRSGYIMEIELRIYVLGNWECGGGIGSKEITMMRIEVCGRAGWSQLICLGMRFQSTLFAPYIETSSSMDSFSVLSIVLSIVGLSDAPGWPMMPSVTKVAGHIWPDNPWGW